MRSGTGARLVAETASGNEGAHKHGGRRSIPNRYEHTTSTSSKPFGHTHRWHARTNRAAATETRVVNRRPPRIMTPTNATSQHPFAKGAPQTRSLACKHAARDFKWDVELRLQCHPQRRSPFASTAPLCGCDMPRHRSRGQFQPSARCLHTTQRRLQCRFPSRYRRATLALAPNSPSCLGRSNRLIHPPSPGPPSEHPSQKALQPSRHCCFGRRCRIRAGCIAVET